MSNTQDYNSDKQLSRKADTDLLENSKRAKQSDSPNLSSTTQPAMNWYDDQNDGSPQRRGGGNQRGNSGYNQGYGPGPGSGYNQGTGYAQGYGQHNYAPYQPERHQNQGGGYYNQPPSSTSGGWEKKGTRGNSNANNDNNNNQSTGKEKEDRAGPSTTVPRAIEKEYGFDYTALLNKWNRGQGATALLKDYLQRCGYEPMKSEFFERQKFDRDRHGVGKGGKLLVHQNTTTITHPEGTFTYTTLRQNKKEAEKIASAQILEQLEEKDIIKHANIIKGKFDLDNQNNSSMGSNSSLSISSLGPSVGVSQVEHIPTTVTERWIQNAKGYLLGVSNKEGMLMKCVPKTNGGPSHNKIFKYEVTLKNRNGDKVWTGSGSGINKKVAERNAYHDICVKLDNCLFWGKPIVAAGQSGVIAGDTHATSQLYHQELNKVKSLCDQLKIPMPQLEHSISRTDCDEEVYKVFIDCSQISPKTYVNVEYPDRLEARWHAVMKLKEIVLEFSKDHPDMHGIDSAAEVVDTSIEWTEGRIVTLTVPPEFERFINRTLGTIQSRNRVIAEDEKPPVSDPDEVKFDIEENLPLFGLEERSREMRNTQLLASLNVSKVTPGITDTRRSLPAYKKKEELLNLIDRYQCIVVSGETGSGKTTQIPQFVLEDMIEKRNGSNARIIVTQPRRISAISVAERVAFERGENLGNSVGYQIRMESVLPYPDGCITFCTTGILLRRLSSPNQLEGISHIIVDEVHERSLETDFLLAILKQLTARRQDIKIILMSATINPGLFCNYFSAPLLEISGRTFEVSKYFLEDILRLTPALKNSHAVCDMIDTQKRSIVEGIEVRHLLPCYELMAAIVEHIVYNEAPGAILIFLPGLEEINSLNYKLQDVLRDQMASVDIHMLHSSLGTISQKAVFDIPPAGRRKIVLSTNIAETSVTIPDILYVLDSALVKEMEYHHERRMRSLTATWISRASTKQRCGRAGRVASGNYYCFLSQHHTKYLPEYQVPEIVRSDLTELCLRAKALHVPNIIMFLQQCIEPPNYSLVNDCLSRLRRLQALDNDEELTPLGWQLSKLSVDPPLGKALIYACMFNCLDPMLTIISSMTVRDPFIMSTENKKESSEAKSCFGHGQRSDHLALLFAFNQWMESQQPNSEISENEFCMKNWLSRATLRQIFDLRYYLYSSLNEAGVVSRFSHRKIPGERIGGPALNSNSSSLPLIKGLLIIAMYPNVAYKSSKKIYKTAFDYQIKIHPSSVTYRDQSATQTPFYLYQDKIQTQETFIKSVSSISMFSLLMFGGEMLNWHPDPVVNNTLGGGNRSALPQSTAMQYSTYGGSSFPLYEFSSSDDYGICTFDGWIHFACKRGLWEQVYTLRMEVENLIFEKLKHPKWDWEKNKENKDLKNCILKFLNLPPPAKKIGNRIEKPSYAKY